MRLTIAAILCTLLTACNSSGDGPPTPTPELPERVTGSMSDGEPCADLFAPTTMPTARPEEVATLTAALCDESGNFDFMALETYIAGAPTVPPLTATAESARCATLYYTATATPDPQPETGDADGVVCLLPFSLTTPDARSPGGLEEWTR